MRKRGRGGEEGEKESKTKRAANHLTHLLLYTGVNIRMYEPCEVVLSTEELAHTRCLRHPP